MKRRFTLNDDGLLVDRQGYVLGRIAAITIDCDEGVGGVFAVKDLPPTGVEQDAKAKQQNTPFPSQTEVVGETKSGDVCPVCRNGTLEPAGSLLVCPVCGGNLPAPIDVPVQRRLGEDGVPVPLLSPTGEIESVWEHYVEVMGPRRKELDPAGRALIRDALKVASAVECKRAIDGCRASAFHMGANDRAKKYNRLSQILKGKRGIRTTREQIDLFLDVAEKAGVGAGDTSADAAMLHEAKRAVLTAWDMPRSEQARKAGDRSAAWLAKHGYRVDHDPDDGRPIFVLVTA